MHPSGILEARLASAHGADDAFCGWEATEIAAPPDTLSDRGDERRATGRQVSRPTRVARARRQNGQDR